MFTSHCADACTAPCVCAHSRAQNITKYQGDPEIMKVLEKVTEIFAPQMQGQQPPK
jgi:hypothetical protein